MRVRWQPDRRHLGGPHRCWLCQLRMVFPELGNRGRLKDLELDIRYRTTFFSSSSMIWREVSLRSDLFFNLMRQVPLFVQGSGLGHIHFKRLV